MGVITHERIKVVGAIGLEILQELEINIEANKHAEVMIKGIADIGKSMKKRYYPTGNHIVKIFILGEDGKEPTKPLFSGFIKSEVFYDEAEFSTIKIELYSGTIALDREKKCRSYQDSKLTYEDIVNLSLSSGAGGFAICRVGEQVYPKKPLIQYMETDWEFCIRLASHFQSAIYPEVTQPVPRIYFGIPDLNEIEEITCSEYTMGISNRYFALGGLESDYNQQDFKYYEVKSMEDYKIGAKAKFAGQNWIVGRKSAKLIRGELVFTYTLCRPMLLSSKKQYNPLFTGMAIPGEVLSVDSETLKLHLSLDPVQEEGKAYPYKWIPDTGSVMYCMPKVGSTVSLYFSNEDEMNGKAVNCVRSNGGNCKNMSDPNKRCLTTEHGKQMFLNPDDMGFSVEDTGDHLTMKDDTSLSMESKHKISIISTKSTKFIGKHVILSTPLNMKMTKN